ncbi:nitroreductase family deazaflavin-dependent oxidoreductase [Nocardia beijingensis]|uniref:nitroreductase family deazaflavin-dependent oxidoreductase n=1 Tax=Nocardia beijingensis TaxID=95162 RepID=UPI001893948B|nr:nitroreductase family deazaflavin-dependent oxidoreductase [Nocardia beijingensis]MBF6467850.1 nitroreductase family deazaflavin-dependent oxidoreductase [Nocardia beijingensis]
MTSIGARLLRTRWFVRAPITLFRARLGFLFGGRLLLLEHTGRRSGRARYVALETVVRPSRDRVVIASGFGTQAQWFRRRIHPGAYRKLGRIVEEATGMGIDAVPMVELTSDL